jgi:pentatricopeptide repeat protein
MPKRSLMPATSVWRNVVQCCCKNEKSKKATAILLDWLSLVNEGKVDKPPVSVFNTVVNTCEVCGEEDLTVKVLDVMKQTLDTEGNMVTFNIALKRLAKLGNVIGCEGILIGMLKEGLEPNVVSYTTTIGACAKEGMKNAAAASMWLERMRTRKVQPNFHTYNTALAACLDGKLESTFIASKIATEMLEDAEKEIACGFQGSARFKSTLPDSYTKVLARQLMKQLRDNWRSGDIDMALAKSTTRVPLLKLVDFDKSIMEETQSVKEIQCDIEDEDEVKENEEKDLEFDLLKELHKDDHRTAMV